MRDYYKILGLKESASAEDIHARWIKLMRKFHPDRGRVDEKRAREINEAYEVLKHPSVRGHYDLKRAYHRKKRRSDLQRLILPPAILIVLFIFGLLSVQRPRVAPVVESTVPSARRSIDIKANLPSSPLPTEYSSRGHTNQINQVNQADDLKLPRSIPEPKTPAIAQKGVRQEILQKNSVKPVTGESKVSRSLPHVHSGAPAKRPSSSKPRVKPSGLSEGVSVVRVATAPNPAIEVEKKVAQPKSPPRIAKFEPPTPIKKNVSLPDQPSVPNEMGKTKQAKNEVNQTDSRNPTNQIDQINEINQTNQIDVPNEPDPLDDLNQQTAQATTPLPLIATEEGVKQFFVQYKERYDQKDIESFLSLFSSKAVQNQRDGFNEIKEIYTGFFDRSQKLRYHLKDMRIEIYQNAVEVWARYTIDQTVKKWRRKKVWKGDIRWILVRENGALKIRYLDFKPQESP